MSSEAETHGTVPQNEAKTYEPAGGDLKARLKASYDIIAPKYNQWTERHSENRLKYLDRLLLLLPSTTPTTPTVSVLELGCGCGIPGTQKLLSRPNVIVTANDISSTQIALARENLAKDGNDDVRGDRVSFIEGDMLSISFPPESLDAVVAFYSIIHLPRDEQVEMISKITRFLKPGGYFLANFSAEAMPGVVMEHWLDEKGWMFWSGWGANATVEKVKESGLEIIVGEVVEDVVDASFLWIIAKK